MVATLATMEVNGQVNVPTTACIDESFGVQNLSTMPGNSYWDFCEGDLSLAPTAVEGSSAELNIPVGAALLEANGNWYGFVCSLNTNSLVRMDFGPSLMNKSPVIVNMGNIGGLLNGPQDIALVTYNGNYYAFVNNRSENKLIRIDFGPDAENTTPAASVVLSGDSFTNGGVDVIFDGVDWFAVTTNEKNITIAKLGNSPENVPSALSLLTTGDIAGLSAVGDVKLVQDAGEWYAFVVGYSSRTLHRLHFPDGLFSEPIAEQILSFGYSPYGLVVEPDKGKWLMLVSTLQGNLLRIDFGASLSNQPEFADLGNLGILNNLLKFDIANSLSRWVGLTTNWNSQSYYIIEFPQANCPFNKEYSTVKDDVLQAQTDGIYHISLHEKFESGLQTVRSQVVEVLNKRAPSVSISTTSICENTTSVFSLASDQSLSLVSWDLGSYGVFDEQDVSIELSSAGVYPVQLQVVSENGCHNRFDGDIKIYPSIAGLASFDLPSGLICTENVNTIVNTTPDIYNGNLLYQWFVDDQLAGSQRDLQYTFTSTGTREVRLRTSIPGCADEIAKTTPPVEAGPAVDFSFNGVCEGDPFGFQSQVSQPINSYHWDFDNGAVSSDPDPSLTFADPGDYAVSLSATNEIGCQTIKTKTVAVHSRPVIDFSAEGLSNACSGQKTYFDNQSTNPDGRAITDWQWAFGDALDTTPSSAASGEHVYDDAGAYNVSLTASTAAGCSASLQKEITIRPSPSTNFTSSPPCEDVAVLFKRPPGGDIASVYWEIGTLYYDEDTLTHVFNSPGDYPFYLEVSSVNGCHSTLSKTIHVPQKLSPDFSVIRNCVNQEAVFTDLTTGQDPVTLREWNLGTAESFSGSQLYYTFTEQTSRSIKLDVTTAAGCSYHVTKTVAIGPGPRANFSAVPSSGAYPLEVAFVNTSSMATHYLWQFSGINVNSTEQSPVVVFPDEGNFDVKLTAFNAQQCEDTFTGTVTAVVPAPDAEIELVNLIRNSDGSAKVVVTIHNVGNTLLKNVPLRFDFAGTLLLQQMVDGPVLPGAKYNFVFNAAIANLETLPYLCVSIDLENDLTPQGNRKCLQFEPELLVFPAFPNPASGTLNVEWISDADTHIRFALIDQVGRTILTSGRATLSGLNQIKLDIRNLDNGHYILLINDGSTESRQRIIIINRP